MRTTVRVTRRLRTRLRASCVRRPGSWSIRRTWWNSPAGSRLRSNRRTRSRPRVRAWFYARDAGGVVERVTQMTRLLQLDKKLREKVRLSLAVNREPKELLVDNYKTLLELLREDLALTGTKHGC